MTNLQRRATFLLGAATLARPARIAAQRPGRLVVVGGGFGGASAARFARMTAPEIEVTLVEPQRRFVTCPYGNLVIAGLRTLSTITHGYEGLAARGVRIIHDRATGIDPVARRVRLSTGPELAYDRLILAPGIALRPGSIAGYDAAAAEVMPHAWMGEDGAQILLLRRQIEAMPDGGVVAISAPPNPYRCPPGPYERASMIAHYLKRHKPRSKILLLDAKERFSKQDLFRDAWRTLYGGMIEWVPSNQDGRVVHVDARERVLETELGTRHRVDVANVIPAQSAASIATESGLADRTGWVPVDARSFEARTAPGIHVVGDANMPGVMPKSGFLANNTAKQAVACALAALRGEAAPAGVYFNTCYSHVGQDYGISVVGIFRPDADGASFVEVPGSGGTSPRGDLPDQRRSEALYADAWYDSITRDMFS
jgi:NADPH-dependent 2,4-dienoyl-CoA reductase/sulfur reductase-like enzyme